MIWNIQEVRNPCSPSFERLPNGSQLFLGWNGVGKYFTVSAELYGTTDWRAAVSCFPEFVRVVGKTLGGDFVCERVGPKPETAT